MRIYFAGPLFTPYERGFIDECAVRLRAEGIEVFVPHEHELALGTDVSAAEIFAKDRVGIEGANAMLAILDREIARCADRSQRRSALRRLKVVADTP